MNDDWRTIPTPDSVWIDASDLFLAKEGKHEHMWLDKPLFVGRARAEQYTLTSLVEEQKQKAVRDALFRISSHFKAIFGGAFFDSSIRMDNPNTLYNISNSQILKAQHVFNRLLKETEETNEA